MLVMMNLSILCKLCVDQVGMIREKYFCIFLPSQVPFMTQYQTAHKTARKMMIVLRIREFHGLKRHI